MDNTIGINVDNSYQVRDFLEKHIYMRVLTNSMAYGTQRFKATFTRALQ